MSSDVDRYIAERVEPTLQRHSARGRSLSSRARQRRNAALLRKLRRIGGAVLAILVGAAIAGWFLPLGTNGVMIVLALIAAAVMLIGLLPATKRVEAQALADADMKSLPLQTEIWLDNQRKALPAPAIGLVDSIGGRLETLSPQLERLNPQDPAALEVRRLLSDHLPELVTGYQSIPAPLRREERNGRVPEQQLVDGLSVIDGEIARMTEQLANGDLDQLATQSRFLELKYLEAKALGADGAVEGS